MEMSLKDFFDSFVKRSDLVVSIYENEELLLDTESVSKILNDYKYLLNRKIDYIDSCAWADMPYLIIGLKIDLKY